MFSLFGTLVTLNRKNRRKHESLYLRVGWIPLAYLEAHTKLDQLRGRLTSLEVPHVRFMQSLSMLGAEMSTVEAVGATVENLKQNHSVFMNDKASDTLVSQS